jgi:hypothetical protein
MPAIGIIFARAMNKTDDLNDRRKIKLDQIAHAKL